jgi:phosphate transport system substrate-binding protein
MVMLGRPPAPAVSTLRPISTPVPSIARTIAAAVRGEGTVRDGIAARSLRCRRSAHNPRSQVIHEKGTSASQASPSRGSGCRPLLALRKEFLNMTTRLRRLGVCAAAVGAFATVVPGTAQAKPVITMSGSTSVAPLATLLAKAYVKKHNVKFKLAQGGSDVGVADVAAGRVTIGNSSRDPKPSDPGGIFFNKIARDAICLVTNPKNPVANLSQDTIQAIFSGNIRDWSQVPGATATGTIDLVGRTAASGTQDAFQKIFMGTKTVSSSLAAKASNGLVQQAVQTDPNAIGYVSLDFIGGVTPAGYNGVSCNLRNAKSGEYGGVRNFWMVTRGRATGAVAKFINWVQTSAAAQKIVAKHWVPLK